MKHAYVVTCEGSYYDSNLPSVCVSRARANQEAARILSEIAENAEIDAGKITARNWQSKFDGINSQIIDSDNVGIDLDIFRVKVLA